MATGSTNVAPMDETPPHPYLNQPKLFVSDLPGHITDEVIAKTLEFCVPFRPRLTRDPVTGNATGSIEFRTIERGDCCFNTAVGFMLIFMFLFQLKKRLLRSMGDPSILHIL